MNNKRMQSLNYFYCLSLKQERCNNSDSYRFGFQGQEAENEITGQTGSHSFFKYRISDNRIGRFFAVDPLTAKYPYYSPYSFSGNRVIDSHELEGLEPENSTITENGENGVFSVKTTSYELDGEISSNYIDNEFHANYIKTVETFTYQGSYNNDGSLNSAQLIFSSSNSYSISAYWRKNGQGETVGLDEYFHKITNSSFSSIVNGFGVAGNFLTKSAPRYPANSLLTNSSKVVTLPSNSKFNLFYKTYKTGNYIDVSGKFTKLGFGLNLLGRTFNFIGYAYSGVCIINDITNYQSGNLRTDFFVLRTIGNVSSFVPHIGPPISLGAIVTEELVTKLGTGFGTIEYSLHEKPIETTIWLINGFSGGGNYNPAWIGNW